jgi:Protein of unknown function (DUF433)
VRARARGRSGEAAMSKSLGRFVVADPAVCHGRPTFRGTRVFVSDVLEDVARGMAWEAIIERMSRSVEHRQRLESGNNSRRSLYPGRETSRMKPRRPCR